MDYDYYIKGDGHIRGPLPWEVIREMFAQGEVKAGYEAACVPAGQQPERSDFGLASSVLSSNPAASPTRAESNHSQSAPASLVSSTDSSFPVVGYALYGLAIGLAIVALFVTYQDSDFDTKVVGGDAYNFIIFAGRGAVWGLAAVVSAVVGSGIHISHSVSQLRSL